MKKYDIYLFDFDLTLANSKKAILMCFHYVLEKHGYNNVTDDEIAATIGWMLSDALSFLTGVEEKDTVEQFRKEYVAFADNVMAKNTVLFDETIPMLKRLKSYGAKIGIVSSKQAYRIQETLDYYNINEYIDILLGGMDVKEPKPAPEGILTGIKRLGGTLENTLYVGDHEYDAMAAQNAGVDFAGILNGHTSREVLEKYPHIVVMDSLDELV